eukprot:TRINITY_DN15850_c0_g1_i1.p1 TRINITY_DN15850_c0_g1~~TRINITY_DN15850_c0_g1_i1.p1  ORF type:complete len:239 (-),score=75.05 TRINITY_DN15850_c0_g1_i1:83-799(-)
MAKVPDFQDPLTIPNNFFTEIKGEKDEGKLLSYCEIVQEEYVDSVDEADRDYTMLINACCKDYLEMVQVLLEKGADINKSDKLGNSPIMLALYNRSMKVAKYLLDNYENDIDYGKINVVGNDLSLLAIHSSEGKDEVALDLLVRYENVNFNHKNHCRDNTLIKLIEDRKNMKAVEVLLVREDLDLHYNKDGKTAIAKLIDNTPDRWEEICKLIVKHPNFNIEQETDEVKQLLESNNII